MGFLGCTFSSLIPWESIQLDPPREKALGSLLYLPLALALGVPIFFLLLIQLTLLHQTVPGVLLWVISLFLVHQHDFLPMPYVLSSVNTHSPSLG